MNGNIKKALRELKKAADKVVKAKAAAWDAAVAQLGVAAGSNELHGVMKAIIELKHRARAAESAERSADQEVERLEREVDRLRAQLVVATQPTCCGDPGDCQCTAVPATKADDLPAGLSWDQAPEWATVLLEHRHDGLYWVEAFDSNARAHHVDKRDTCSLAFNAEGPEGYLAWWTLIATRPTKQPTCTDCGAIPTSPHACGKPGVHGEQEPAAVDDGGWIEWEGGECPVPAGTLVDVKFRDGGLHTSSAPEDLRFEWADESHPFWCAGFDIIAYRLTPTH